MCEQQAVRSIRACSKIWRFMFSEFFKIKLKQFSCVLTLFLHLSYIKIHISNIPECVTYAILEVNKVVAVDPHQVSAVEVQISFLQNIAESFPLSMFLVVDIANKRGNTCDLWHQQSHLTLKTRELPVVTWTVDSSFVKTTIQNTKIKTVSSANISLPLGDSTHRPLTPRTGSSRSKSYWIRV